MKLASLLFVLLISSVVGAKEKPDMPKTGEVVNCTGLKGKDRDDCLNRKFPDMWNMNKPVNSIGEAAIQKPMLISEIGLVASTVFDIEGTQHCIANHTCTEGNPLLGNSRAQAYPVGLAADTLLIVTAAYLRKNQHGNAALFFLLWAPTVVHITFGADGFRR